jgi:cation:H+ antiporter
VRCSGKWRDVLFPILVFAAAAVAVWLAGVRLSDSTDVLASRFGLGEALGGLILLAIATNLPEIAITVSAALSGELGIAIGNILGGIAIQTVVLVAVDAFGIHGGRPLTYRAASLQLVLEGSLVVAVLLIAVTGTQLPSSLVAWRLAPGGVLIAIAWVVGILLIGKARSGLPWHEEGRAPDGQGAPQGAARDRKKEASEKRRESTRRVVLIFAAAAIVTLAGGIALEESGTRIADHIGMSGVLFGSTVLAASTSLPEVSTGLASTKLGDYSLAISDIFGGNAFLPVLFLVASLLSGEAVLPQAHPTDIYLAALGALLTIVYMYGLVFRPARRLGGIGIDSLVVLILYVIGIAGLVAVAHG